MSMATQVHGNGYTVRPGPGEATSTDDESSNISSRNDATSRTRYFNPVPPPYLPGGTRSLTGISLHAFALGLVAGLCTCLTVLLVSKGLTSEPRSPGSVASDTTCHVGYLWRIPFFIATLATFHYLEFDMTARYNTIDAKVSSFLLFNNGWAYNVAHCSAMLECVITWLMRSKYTAHLPTLRMVLSSLGVDLTRMESLVVFPTIPTSLPVILGLSMIIVGQTTRSLAMKTAGTSFNHIVQATKKVDHVLVNHGVYGICRHPSYFGFFWWAIGTQVVLGNRICLLGYGVVLWNFFSHRIANEEKHLIHFFGGSYVEYRNKTPVLIPFIS